MAKKRKILSSSEFWIFGSILLAFIELGTKYFMKYSLNRLSVLDFSILNIGNLINLFSVLAVSVALLRLMYSNSSSKFVIARRAFLILLFALVFDYVALFMRVFEVNITSLYLFFYPLNKIIIGSIYIFNQLCLFLIFYYVFIKTKDNKKYPALKSLLYSMFSFVFIVLSAFIYTTFFTGDEFTKKKQYTYRVGVVLGAAVWKKEEPSPIFKGRILKAKALLDSNVIDIIQVTGGKAPGELTESQAANKFLTEAGVKSKDIWIESRTSTTSEQILYAREHIQKRVGTGNIIIISDRFHLPRIITMCDFFNVDAKVAPSDYVLNWRREFYYSARESLALLLFWIFAI